MFYIRTRTKNGPVKYVSSAELGKQLHFTEDFDQALRVEDFGKAQRILDDALKPWRKADILRAI